MLNRKQLYLSIGGTAIVIFGSALAIHSLRPASAATVTTAAPVAAAADTPPVPGAVDVAPEALTNMNLHFANAALRPGVREISAMGVVGFNAKRLARVSSPSRGRVVAIDVTVGQRVHAGQRLAVLDQFDLSDVRNQIASAESSVAEASAAAETAQAALTRATELVAAGGMAQSELERRRSAAAGAQAMLRSRQADLKKWLDMRERLMPTGDIAKKGDNAALARLGPRDSLGAVVAPFDGVVSSVGTAPGDIVDTSLQIFAVADLSTVWVQANVPERELAAVREGDAVALSVDAYPGRQFSGRVIDVADQVDPSTGTVAVRCEVPNADGALRANMFATVDIQAPLGRDAVLVPDAALQDVNGKTGVFTLSSKGHFVWHAVHTGVEGGGLTEIVDGVPANTLVVTDGSYWLKAALLQGAIPNE